MCTNKRAVTVKGYGEIVVPCGKCPSCINRKVDDWVFRCIQEDQVSNSSYFVTLTYDIPHVPFDDRGRMSLNKGDLQKFFKRLRYYHEKNNWSGDLRGEKKGIKYLACGEYGDSRKRPHYHAVIFNSHPRDIELAWDMGAIHIGNVTNKSIAYVVKYMNKEYSDRRTGPYPEYYWKNRPFRVSSKNLGISYLTDEIIKYHKADPDRNYVTIDGYKKALPRYYRNKIYTDDEKIQLLSHVNEKILEKDLTDKEKFLTLLFDRNTIEYFKREDSGYLDTLWDFEKARRAEGKRRRFVHKLGKRNID